MQRIGLTAIGFSELAALADAKLLPCLGLCTRGLHRVGRAVCLMKIGERIAGDRVGPCRGDEGATIGRRSRNDSLAGCKWRAEQHGERFFHRVH